MTFMNICLCLMELSAFEYFTNTDLINELYSEVVLPFSFATCDVTCVAQSWSHSPVLAACKMYVNPRGFFQTLVSTSTYWQF